MVAGGRPRFPVSLRRSFWKEIRSGLSLVEATKVLGVSQRAARQWFAEVGGVNPYGACEVSGRYLSVEEREEIAVGIAAGRTQGQIARDLGRSASTISRELARNSPTQDTHRTKASRSYRARFAQSQADARARRPKALKITGHPRLLAEVQAGLDQHWSPEQISNRMRLIHPDDEGMRVSHETIYKTLYLQGRGQLKRDLTTALRNRPGAAQTAPDQHRKARPDPRQGPHQPTPSRGLRPGRARALGG